MLESRPLPAGTLAHRLPPLGRAPPTAVSCVTVFHLPPSILYLKCPRLLGIGSVITEGYAHNQSFPFLHLLSLSSKSTHSFITHAPGIYRTGQVPALEKVPFE